MNLTELEPPTSVASDTGLPEGWTITTLGEVTAPSTTKVEPYDYPDATYLSLEHIEAHTGRILGHGTGSDVSSTKAVFHAGDVLYGKLRPYLNKVCRPDFDGICSTDIIVFPQSSYVDNQFLWRFLMRADVVDFANHNSNGINLPRTSFEKLRELEFPLPPLAEQRRIVAKIEQLLTAANASREHLARVPAIMKRFRQSVLAAACSGRLTADWREQNPGVEPASRLLERILTERRTRWETEQIIKKQDKSSALLLDVNVTLTAQEQAKYQKPTTPDTTGLSELPETWCWVSLNQMYWNAGYGTSAKCEGRASGPPVLRIPNVAQGQVNLANMKYAIQEDGFDRGGSLAPGDFLIVRTNGSQDLIGRGSLVTEMYDRPYYFASYLIRLRLITYQGIERFVAWLWQSQYIRDLLEQDAVSSAGQYNISLSKLSQFPLPIPPLEEQQEIVRRVETLFKFADAVEKRSAAATTHANRLTQAVLSKAFHGELVETEGELARAERREYESAAELLKRVHEDDSSRNGTIDRSRQTSKGKEKIVNK
jgi:type I restriction enzyme S subunit